MVNSVFDENDLNKYFEAIQKLLLFPKNDWGYHVKNNTIYYETQEIPVKYFSTSGHVFKILASP